MCCWWRDEVAIQLVEVEMNKEALLQTGDDSTTYIWGNCSSSSSSSCLLISLSYLCAVDGGMKQLFNLLRWIWTKKHCCRQMTIVLPTGNCISSSSSSCLLISRSYLCAGNGSDRMKLLSIQLPQVDTGLSKCYFTWKSWKLTTCYFHFGRW